MDFIFTFLSRLGPEDPEEQGQGLAEYALILALIAVIAIASLAFLGDQIAAILSQIGTSI